MSEQQPDPNSEEDVQPSNEATNSEDTPTTWQSQARTAKKKSQGNTRLKRVFEPTVLITALLTTVFGVIGMYISLSGLIEPNGGRVAIDERLAQLEELVATSSTEIDGVRQDIDSIRAQLEAVEQIPEDTAITVRLQSLEATMANLESTLTGIEEIIVQDPEEALEITMLKRDIEQAQAFNQSQLDALARLIEQTNTWVTVSIVGLFVAVLAPSVERLREWFRKGRDEPADQE